MNGDCTINGVGSLPKVDREGDIWGLWGGGGGGGGGWSLASWLFIALLVEGTADLPELSKNKKGWGA